MVRDLFRMMSGNFKIVWSKIPGLRIGHSRKTWFDFDPGSMTEKDTNEVKKELEAITRRIETLEARCNIEPQQKIPQFIKDNPETAKPEPGPGLATMTNKTPQSKPKWTKGIVARLRGNRQKSAPKSVAFTAILSNQLSSLSVDQNIVFDEVEENFGGAYLAHHGLFIAPVPGVYVFHTTIFVEPQNSVLCALNVNGIDKASVCLPGTDYYHSGSQMIVVLLMSGDEVSVRCKSNSSVIHVHSNGKSYPSFTGYGNFTGFLLYDTT